MSVPLLRLIRETPINETTLGVLFVANAFVCFTLEDMIREQPGVPVEAWKVPQRTCIPAGQYHVAITWSQKFQRLLPEIQQVPGFTGIRIHPLNLATQTDGCIGVGFARSGASIQESKAATVVVEARIQAALTAGLAPTIRIENPYGWPSA